MASDNAPEGSGVSVRYKERYKKTPSVFVEHDVGAYKRILIHDNQQPCKYTKQPKARHRSYRLKSAMDAGLDSNLESCQESVGYEANSDLPLSKNSSPEHGSSKEHRSSLEPLEVDSSGDVAADDREYENAAHSDGMSVEGYGCTNESINEIHSYQVREGNDLEDSEVVLCGPTSQ